MDQSANGTISEKISQRTGCQRTQNWTWFVSKSSVKLPQYAWSMLAFPGGEKYEKKERERKKREAEQRKGKRTA